MYFEALASGGDDWYNIVLITAPEGASITFDDGDEEVIVTGTGMQYPVPLHNDSSTYSITINANGFVKTDSVTTSATSGEVFTKIIKYAKITLTYDDAFRGQNFNITDGSISPSTQQVFPSTGNTIDLYVPNTGTWKTSSSAAGESYESKGATVTDIDGSYVDELHTRPDGKTVLPTDDIQTWLECAGIKDKSYTTLAEVLADHDTLATLITEQNAVDYMVRSKAWISRGLVPILTADSSNVFVTSSYSGRQKWWIFDGKQVTDGNQIWTSNSTTTPLVIGYKFDKPKIVKQIGIMFGVFDGLAMNVSTTFVVQGSNDTTTGLDGTWTDVSDQIVDTTNTFTRYYFNNNVAYKAYRIYISAQTLNGASYKGVVNEMQFYLANQTEDIGLTDDPTAMRYIGLRNYASDTLLDDEDWCEAICDSAYFESVLNAKVPIMTSNTQPSGEAIGNDLRGSTGNTVLYRLYDDNDTTSPDPIYDYTGNPNSYYGYGFETPKIIKKVSFIIQPTAALKKVKIYGSQTKETDLSNTTLIDEISIALPANTKSTASVLLNNDNAYKYYYFQVNISSSGNYASTYTLQFYGRQDVDESLIHIYSAASDNDIHYLNGSTPVTVASTDTDGHGTIARTLLPAGTYDLYSSVAMDPDGDLSTEYFHKEVTVKADTIEIMLMPSDGVNMAYWYGYKGNINGNMKSVIPSTTYTGVTNIDTNTFYIDTSGAAGVITPLPVTNKIAKAIAQLKNASNVSQYLDVFNGTASGNPIKQTTDKLTNLHLMTCDVTLENITDDMYIAYHTTSGSQGTSNGRVYALWAE